MERDEILFDETGRAYGERLSLAELSSETGLPDHRLRRLLVLGVIDPSPDGGAAGELLFPATVLPRIHRLMRLHDDLRLNYASLGLVLDLLERVERLECRLATRR